MFYPNLFKNRYSSLKGKDWIKRISPEDKRVFIELGLKHVQYGRLGGIARAKTAKRNEKGQFI